MYVEASKKSDQKKKLKMPVEKPACQEYIPNARNSLEEHVQPHTPGSRYESTYTKIF